jgi:hypothetical protein
MITPLEQLIVRLKDLGANETTKDGTKAYLLAIAAADSLLDDEQRFINKLRTMHLSQDSDKYR